MNICKNKKSRDIYIIDIHVLHDVCIEFLTYYEKWQHYNQTSEIRHEYLQKKSLNAKRHIQNRCTFIKWCMHRVSKILCEMTTFEITYYYLTKRCYKLIYYTVTFSV
jgi:hypothetical protein